MNTHTEDQSMEDEREAFDREHFNSWYEREPMPELLARVDPQQAAHNAFEEGVRYARAALRAPVEVAQPHGVLKCLHERLMECMALGLTVAEAYDSHYQAETELELAGAPQKYDDTLLPFLALMRRELHANSGKGDRPGWLAMDRKTALLEVHHHLAKLQKAVLSDDGPGVQEFAADVANMAMMVLDVCGGLAALSPEVSSHKQGDALQEARPGWRLVPVEPTFEMKLAASQSWKPARDGHYTARMEVGAEVWAAMLAATPPQAPHKDQEQQG
jgi:hypothetical protein